MSVGGGFTTAAGCALLLAGLTPRLHRFNNRLWACKHAHLNARVVATASLSVGAG